MGCVVEVLLPDELARRLPSFQADLKRNAELNNRAFRLAEELLATRVALAEQTALASSVSVRVVAWHCCSPMGNNSVEASKKLPAGAHTGDVAGDTRI